MKIIFLNTWNANLPGPMADFITSNLDADIFCLQEAESEMQAIADSLLPNHTKLYNEKYVSEHDHFNQAIYLANNIVVQDSGELLRADNLHGLANYVQITVGDELLYICNVHGTPKPSDKLDTQARQSQSQIIIDFFANKPGQKIIGGDFNLLPTTQSVKAFVQAGYKDLISDYGITSTRNHVSWAKHPGNKQYFADYVFVSARVSVASYQVPYNEVSDHLPQILVVKD